MKKLLYVIVAGSVMLGFTDCKNRTQTASAAETAKTYTESCYRTGNYDKFVEAIHFEKETPKKVVKQEKQTYAATLKKHNEPEVQQRGGLKESKVVSENIAPDGNTAEVLLKNYYNDGSIEDIRYNMVRDDNKWKIQVGNDKEVWRTTNARGQDVVVKLKDNDYKSFVKVKVDGEKAFVKDIEPAGSDKEVVKVQDMEGNRTVVKDVQRDAATEVVRVKDADGDLKVVKEKSTDSKEVLKVKEDGHKDVVKVIEKADGTTEIKTKHDGEKHIETIREDGVLTVEK